MGERVGDFWDNSLGTPAGPNTRLPDGRQGRTSPPDAPRPTDHHTVGTMTTASLFPFAPSRGNLFPSHAALSKTAQDTATAAGPGRPPNHSSSRPPSRLSYPSAPPQDPGDRPDAYVPGRPPCGGSDSTATGQSEERGERGKKDRLRRAGRGDDTAERGPATTARAAETGPSRKGSEGRSRRISNLEINQATQ